MKMNPRVVESQLRAYNQHVGVMGDYIGMADISAYTGISTRALHDALRGAGRIGSARATRYYIPHVAQALCR